MKVSKTLELSIPEDIDIDKLERYLAREMKKFGKHLFEKVLQEIETKKLEEAKGRLPGESTPIPVHQADKI